MKTFSIVFFVCFLMLQDLFAEVRNGYQRDVVHLRRHLENLQSRLANDELLSSGERRKIRQDIKAIRSYLTFHELTKTLLERFKAVSPALYKKVDELRDQRGNAIHTYVKFLPEDTRGLPSTGVLSFVPYVNDSVACTSEFGTNSATVRIRLTNDALEVLAHEFGHLTYIVENLTTYIVYYRRIYGGHVSGGDMGHRGDDPSGTQANLCARQYRMDRADRARRGKVKELPPLALFVSIYRALPAASEKQAIPFVVQGGLEVFLPPGPGHWYILP